ncbi:MAG: glycosyltransferase family 4 protein [Planctomycetaceae bacterium]|nr:glycosyltransferase family 4 protein [Planctomycetaceae bacterium]
MKIALALESFDPQSGEMEALAFEFARGLLRLNHEVHVVAQHFSKAGSEIPIVPHRIGSSRSPLRRAAAAEAKLRPLRADVVHDLGITWYADVFSSRDGSALGEQQRQLADAAWWARPFKRMVIRRSPRRRQQAELAIRQLDGDDSIVLAPSQMVARDYCVIHDLAPERVRVVHPGVDIKKFSPHIRKLRREAVRRRLGIDARTLLLLALADDYQQGTWHVVFRALRRLSGKRVPAHLVVVGDRRVTPPQRLVDRFGLAENVTVVGPIDDRLPYYAAADVLLVPTRYAPFSLSLLEAAACGLPSITTQGNGAAELFTDGSDIHLFDGGAADLADRVERFRDSARAERMGLAARRTAMKHPLDRSFSQVVATYEEVATARARAVRNDGAVLALEHAAGSDFVHRRAA